MAKNKKGKQEKKLDNIDNGLDSILNQYKVIPKKDRKKTISKLKKDLRKEKKSFKSTNEGKHLFRIKGLESKIKKVEEQSERINISYGIFDFKVKHSYLLRIKNKEQYLDGLFNRKMKNVLGKIETPKNESQAKELQGLITQYSKKIRESKFYDPKMIKGNLKKLEGFRNNVLSTFDYSDFVSKKIKQIDEEIKIFEKEKELKKLKNKLRYLTKNKYLRELNKVKILSLKSEIKNKETEISSMFTEDDEELVEVYKAIEKPILIDDMLIGIQFNFF